MKKSTIRKICLFLLTTTLVLSPFLTVKAATGIEITSGSSIDSFPKILEWIINVFLVGVLGIIAFVALIIGGFMYLLAGPDAAKAEKGKKTISYAITGLIIASLAYSFTAIVVNLLNDVFK